MMAVSVLHGCATAAPSSTATGGGGGVAVTAAVVRWPIQYHLLMKVLLVLRVLSLLHLLLGEAGCLVTCKTNCSHQ